MKFHHGRPYLIQRLTKAKGFINPWGDRNAEVVQGIENIFTPEYMGAAEYEHGVYAKAIDGFVKAAMKTWGDGSMFSKTCSSLKLDTIDIKIPSLSSIDYGEDKNGCIVSAREIILTLNVNILWWASHQSKHQSFFIEPNMYHGGDGASIQKRIEWLNDSSFVDREAIKADYGSFYKSLMNVVIKDDDKKHNVGETIAWLDVGLKNQEEGGYIFSLDRLFLLGVKVAIHKLANQAEEVK